MDRYAVNQSDWLRPKATHAHAGKKAVIFLPPFVDVDVKRNLAEGVRFELTRPFGLPVFKTGAINRSATPPGMDGQRPTSNVQRPTLNAEKC
jgi:hypothetical protein